MGNKFLLFCFLIFISCTNEESTENKDNITTEALYKYDLPADGCDWHFQIIGKPEILQLVEDDASMQKTETLKKEAKKVIGLPNVTVELTYKLTGITQKVQCGWNKTQDMKEINIVKVEIK